MSQYLNTDPQPFAGRTGVVTGAASGIGRGVALALAEGGATVLAVDLNRDGVAETAGLGRRDRITPFVGDVTDESITQEYARASQNLGSAPSFFFNNAGVEGPQVRIGDLAVDQWDRHIEINLRSVFLGLRAMIPLMRPGGGAIVNTGSVLSLVGGASAGAYTATKHAVLGLTRSVAVEEAGSRIRVNCICPGPIDTPLQHRAEKNVGRREQVDGRAFFEAMVPAGRYGTVQEVVDLVIFLLQPNQEYVTGASFAIDGGMTSSLM